MSEIVKDDEWWRSVRECVDQAPPATDEQWAAVAAVLGSTTDDAAGDAA